jgi:phage shock protein A
MTVARKAETSSQTILAGEPVEWWGQNEFAESGVAAMSIIGKLSLALKARANKVLDRMEDPRETLEYSYQRQLELLTKVQHGVADVAASRVRIESRMRALRLEQTDLSANTEGGPGSAEVLKRKAKVDSELSGLAAQNESLRAEEEELVASTEKLAAKLRAFQVRKDTIKATYTAAEARGKVSEAWSGVSEAMEKSSISYNQRREILTRFACSIDVMAASRKGLEEQIATLRQLDQARQTPDTGHAESVEQTSEQETKIESQLSELAVQLDSLREYEDRAMSACEQLAARTEELRTHEGTVT